MSNEVTQKLNLYILIFVDSRLKKDHIAFVIGKDNENELLPVLEFGIEVGITGLHITPLRIVTPISDCNDYIRENNDYIRKNNVYDHLDTIIPILREVKERADEYNIEIITPIAFAEAAEPRKIINGGGRKCERPFTMLRIEMDGTVYMCSGAQRANFNVFDADPLAIWNSDRFKELRCQLDTEEYDEICSDCHIIRYSAEIEKMNLGLLRYRIVEDIVVDSKEQPVAGNPQIAGWMESLEQTSKSLTITGWASDLGADKPCKFVIAFVNDVARAAVRPSLRRTDVANKLNRARLAMSGYKITIANLDETAGPDVRVRVFALDGVGNIRELWRNPDIAPTTRCAVWARALGESATGFHPQN
jgi:radical SAM protein with 4Fe4S-binding SPASM domain